MEVLAQELEFFAENKADWMKIHPGKFVLVKGRELLGVFDTAESALTEGARQFGAESFLVRQVIAGEENIYIPALALGLLYASPA
ncbi:MAG: hypothetical protein HY674_00205 [Chloroflexi bacterium]|nr:hypothetical protein [Chloroflexota bacterium]